MSNECKLSRYLAYGMAIYTFASIYYLIMTFNIGTPFKDSLTINQIKIKEKSIRVRKTIFYTGLTIGVVFLYIIDPFKKCV